MQLRKLEDLDLEGKKVLLRLDLNVPVKNGKITDDTRIQAALPTLRYILERSSKIAVMSHLGRPKGHIDPAYSLELVGGHLAELIGKEVVFVRDYAEEPLAHVLNQLDKNQIILLENLRFHPGETANDMDFARCLASGFDFYVNDAFGTLHRAHASVVGAAQLLRPENRAAGLLVSKEIEQMTQLQSRPEAPFTVILGGAKVSDKVGVILNLLNNCNTLLIGGAMAYTFLKYNGVAVGTSKVEDDKMELIEKIYRNAEARKVKILLPEDHIVADAFAEDAEVKKIDHAEIPAGYMGLDIGPKTINRFRDLIDQSKTVLWNGPMGVFEWQPFARGTMDVAKAVARCSGFTVVGGGDSVAAINQAGVADRIGHVSTGGGASLEYLEGKLLPGIKVLLK